MPTSVESQNKLNAAMVVQMTVGGLRELVRAEICKALAESRTAPALLTQDQLAEELGVSGRSVYTLRQSGLPVIMVLDSPRFVLADVLAWLRAREAAAEQARAA